MWKDWCVMCATGIGFMFSFFMLKQQIKIALTMKDSNIYFKKEINLILISQFYLLLCTKIDQSNEKNWFIWWGTEQRGWIFLYIRDGTYVLFRREIQGSTLWHIKWTLSSWKTKVSKYYHKNLLGKFYNFFPSQCCSLKAKEGQIHRDIYI